MQTLPHAESASQYQPSSESVRIRPAMEETVYRMMTICAILLVLGSLWAF